MNLTGRIKAGRHSTELPGVWRGQGRLENSDRVLKSDLKIKGDD